MAHSLRLGSGVQTCPFAKDVTAHMDLPYVPRTARPGAGLPTVCGVNTSKRCALPAGHGRVGGWCRLACNSLTVLGCPYEKAGSRPSSPLAWAAPNPQPEPLQRALPFSARAGPDAYADQQVGQRPHRRGGRGPEGADRTRWPYCAPHTLLPHQHPGWGLWPTQLSGEPFPHPPQGPL